MTLPIRAIAKAVGRSTSTVRRDVRRGAPTVSLGSIGRGHGTVMDLEAYECWLAQQAVPSLTHRAHDDTLKVIETALIDCLKRDSLAESVGLTDAQAALCVLLIFKRAYLNVHREPLTLDTLPSELKNRYAIYLESVEQGNFSTQRR